MIRLEKRSGALIAYYDVATEKAAVEAAVKERVSLMGLNAAYMDLRGANLRGANLKNADLRGADLRGVDLRGSIVKGADYKGAQFDLTVNIDYWLQPTVAFSNPPVAASERQRRHAEELQWREQERRRVSNKRVARAHRRILAERAKQEQAKTPHPIAISDTLQRQMATFYEWGDRIPSITGADITRFQATIAEIGAQARAGSARLIQEMAQQKEEQHP